MLDEVQLPLPLAPDLAITHALEGGDLVFEGFLHTYHADRATFFADP